MRQFVIRSLPLVLLIAAACGGSPEAPAEGAAGSPAPPAVTPPSTAPAGTPPSAAPDAAPPGPQSAIPGPKLAMDARIDPSVRDAVRAEQQRLLDSLRDDDPTVLEAVFEPSMLPRSPAAARKYYERLRTEVLNGDVGYVHEFHYVPESNQPVPVATEDADGMLVVVPPAGPQVYVVLQQLRADLRDDLLAAIWVQRGTDWRLVSLQLGGLRLEGKSATDWYREASALADDGLALPAWLRLTLADDLLYSIPFVQYAHAGEAEALKERLAAELSARYAFPLTLTDVAEEPQVVRIDPTFLQGSLSPAVHYVTRRDLQDPGLNDEAQAVADALARLYPGFCHEATNVALAAYTELPANPQRDYLHAAFVASCP